jgi:cation diffusion facilitator CzcD-associated flavoprotein CzcO
MNPLDALERRVRRDLELLQYPRRAWLTPRTGADGQPVLDVLVVGAGQGGLACAAGLLRENIANALVVDQNPLDRAGPWLDFARMVTLRTPKYVTGPDLGIPSLTIEAWYEAQHGEGSWETMGLVPKETWAAYLGWYRRILNIPVRAGTRVEMIAWREAEGCFAVEVVEDGTRDVLLARRIVWATGIEGSGQWDIPGFVREGVPEHLRAHTRDPIDFEALRGKRVGVLGAGASAFDNAAMALEFGAREVHQFFRRAKLVDVNAYRWAEFVGFLKHHGDLPDADRWKFVRQIVRMGQLPPADTLERARNNPGFCLHPSSPWEKVETLGDTVRVTTPGGVFELDFVIAGTGFVTDLSRRSELAGIWPHIALWRDRFTPPDDERHPDLERHPYLGPGFEFMEKVPGEAPWVERIHNYTFGCLVSLGFGGASISGMKYSLPRLIGGITRGFFLEERAQHLQSLREYDVKEF